MPLTVIVTGGAGFIGVIFYAIVAKREIALKQSNEARYWLKLM